MVTQGRSRSRHFISSEGGGTESREGGSSMDDEAHIYVCARMGTGGKSKYVPKHPEQERKIGNKRMDCSCRVVGKSYPGRATILGKCENSHSHPIGAENLIYTRIPPEVQSKIAQDLRDGIRPDIVLARARGNVHTEHNLPNLASQAPRTYYENMLLFTVILGKIQFRYAESLLLLCWWHVLHAWQKHFVITHFTELWDKLKGWIRITDSDEFWACWEEIKALAPDSVIEYLEEYYVSETTLKMWSAMYRKDQKVFELCDTNMLVEAWHHILKTHHMEGKRNRRVDQLIHTLIHVALPNYIANHRAQQFGFHGPDLALQKRNQINNAAESIGPEMIEEIQSGRLFSVKSQSTPGLRYTVDLENNFPDLVVPRSLPIASQPWDEADYIQPFVSPSATTARPVPAVSGEDAELLDIILKKLQAMQQANSSLTAPLATSLRQLDTSLTEATNGAEILPRRVNVVPNQGTKNGTESVMGTRRKGGKKCKNTDGYCGGESSGKSARPDARASKKARIIPPGDAPVDEGLTGLFDVLVTPDDGLDGHFDDLVTAPQNTVADGEETLEAREKLLRIIATYNTVFPPDAPRTTSYYRDNGFIITTPGSYYRTR
ncbi:hypothetical protein MVEN_00088300 [Mycena venus]|uniref:Uncharacterized protein n=1 Tax=Mycena venus TaxID=2733690 RepID=A0A8H6Z8J7_9AGAR|nr:hypothetical protein MVEN_00088300 [Mycena venus]